MLRKVSSTGEEAVVITQSLCGGGLLRLIIFRSLLFVGPNGVIVSFPLYLLVLSCHFISEVSLIFN